MTKETMTRHGVMKYLKEDSCIGKSLELYGEWAIDEIDLFEKLVKKGSTVLDIGANYGVHSLGLANIIGAEGMLYSFEPQDDVYKILENNIKNNTNDINFKIYNSLVGDTCRNVPIPENIRNNNNIGAVSFLDFLDDTNNITSEKSMITIDSINLTKCDFIKIDVEGMEEYVIRGSITTIKKFKPIIFFETNSIDDGWGNINIINEISDNYKFFLMYSKSYNANNYKNSSIDIFDSNMETNIVAIPNNTIDIPKELIPINNLNDFIVDMIYIKRAPDHAITKIRDRIFKTINLENLNMKIQTLGEELEYTRTIVEERDTQLQNKNSEIDSVGKKLTYANSI
ncbi:MAG: FkbM family methyltransferase, partial [Bacteroidales bacterium]|nr:FkbM family methyltransferase [Bacteroidales bacterium]